MTSLYIHIPFCAKKCHYCSFTSYEGAYDYFAPYFAALKREIAKKIQNKSLKTLYIGGGTPSIVPVDLYKKLSFEFDKDYEFTIELNPTTVDFDYLTQLKELGVNRLSIGVQSFDDDLLNTIGRAHSAKEAIASVELAQKVGFDNVSIDLIYGLPKQSMAIWQDTLKTAMELNIQHISTYGLKIEEGTPFFHNTPESLPEDDETADMYLECIEHLKRSGFEHYEISNFAKKGFSSQHNITYWSNDNYIACGVSAHGYEGNVRYENTLSLEEYLKNPYAQSEYTLCGNDILEEGIFLGLRLVEGIDLAKFNDRYGVNFYEKYSHILDKYKDFFVLNDKKVALTTEGLMLSNKILSEFLE